MSRNCHGTSVGVTVSFHLWTKSMKKSLVVHDVITKTGYYSKRQTQYSRLIMFEVLDWDLLIRLYQWKYVLFTFLLVVIDIYI